MGRDIYCEIRKRGYEESPEENEHYVDEGSVWSSLDALDLFVCGRDDATNFLACQGDKNDRINITDLKTMHDILKELKHYAKDDRQNIENVERLIRDLKNARSHARNYDEFASFLDPISEAERWIKEEGWSRAEALINMINASYCEFHKHPLRYHNCDLYIVISE